MKEKKWRKEKMETIEFIILAFVLQLIVIIIMMSSLFLLINYLMNCHFKYKEEKMFKEADLKSKIQVKQMEREFKEFKDKNW